MPKELRVYLYSALQNNTSFQFSSLVYRRSELPFKIYEGVYKFMIDYLLMKQRHKYSVMKTTLTNLTALLTLWYISTTLIPATCDPEIS